MHAIDARPLQRAVRAEKMHPEVHAHFPRTCLTTVHASFVSRCRTRRARTDFSFSASPSRSSSSPSPRPPPPRPHPPSPRPPSLRRRPRRTRCPQRRTRSHILPSSPLSSSMCESSYVFSPSSASSSSSSSEANSSPHLIPSTKPLPARDKKLKDGAPCIGGIHTSAAVSTGSVILLPLTAPGHNCAVITRPLVPQWTHIRRPPIGQLSHLMKEAIGRNQTQSDTIIRNHTQSSAVVPVNRGALAPAHSRRLASDPGTASPSHAQTWRTLGTRLGNRMRVVRKPTPVAGAARPSYPRGAEA